MGEISCEVLSSFSMLLKLCLPNVSAEIRMRKTDDAGDAYQSTRIVDVVSWCATTSDTSVELHGM